METSKTVAITKGKKHSINITVIVMKSLTPSKTGFSVMNVRFLTRSQCFFGLPEYLFLNAAEYSRGENVIHFDFRCSTLRILMKFRQKPQDSKCLPFIPKLSPISNDHRLTKGILIKFHATV